MFDLPQHHEPLISVRDGRAVVSRYVVLTQASFTYESATNWEDLEPVATNEVFDQGGATNMSGLYRCSSALAEQARY